MLKTSKYMISIDPYTYHQLSLLSLESASLVVRYLPTLFSIKCLLYYSLIRISLWRAGLKDRLAKSWPFRLTRPTRPTSPSNYYYFYHQFVPLVVVFILVKSECFLDLNLREYHWTNISRVRQILESLIGGLIPGYWDNVCLRRLFLWFKYPFMVATSPILNSLVNSDFKWIYSNKLIQLFLF